jgi:hypothetical protein
MEWWRVGDWDALRDAGKLSDEDCHELTEYFHEGNPWVET